MKAVQIGILAALVLCAGLLFTVYKNQQPPAPNAAQTAAPAPVPAAEPVPPPAAQPAAPAPEAVPAAEPPAPARAAVPAPPVHRKPSPAGSYRKSEGRQSAVTPAATAPAPAPAPATVPQPAPQAASVPAPAPEQPRAATAESPSTVPFTPAPEPPREPHHVTVPAGTTVTVRLAETINSEQRKSGDTFSATLDQPLVVDGFAIAERGAKVTGTILEAQQAGRVRGLSAITLQLTKLRTSDGQDVNISTEKFAKQGEKSTGDDAKKVGVGAALGAAIGAIAGGGKGAAIGAGVGGAAGAGTVMATRGKPVELPVETRLTFKLAEAVTLTEKIR